MRVRATRDGYYDHYRTAGDVFDIDPAMFTDMWMVSADTPLPDTSSPVGALEIAEIDDRAAFVDRLTAQNAELSRQLAELQALLAAPSPAATGEVLTESGPEPPVEAAPAPAEATTGRRRRTVS